MDDKPISLGCGISGRPYDDRDGVPEDWIDGDMFPPSHGRNSARSISRCRDPDYRLLHRFQLLSLLYRRSFNVSGMHYSPFLRIFLTLAHPSDSAWLFRMS